MNSNKFKKPVVLYFLGAPGTGKTFVARQIADLLGMAHVSSERLRSELFSDPSHDKSEFQVINQLMQYMTEEYLKNGMSVVYDISLSRVYDRKNLREISRRLKAKELLIWIQLDNNVAWQRLQNRDKRKADDKFASPLNRQQFEQYVRIMQSPQSEDYLVLSGKHLFNSQKQAILRRLNDMNVLNLEALQHKVPKPELVNLVSKAQIQAGRVDYSRRNISIQ